MGDPPARANLIDGFHHVFHPGRRKDAPTFLLLHGTGGNESDLIPVAGILDPDAAILGVRGRVLENGMPRFFRRISPGVLDEDDLRMRAKELGEFLTGAASRYGFDPAGVVALGFSNGANIAAAMIWDGPRLLNCAILFRPMLPYQDGEPAASDGCRIFIGAGDADPMVSRAAVELLGRRLRAAGADVTIEWQPAGHNLSEGDVLGALRWLDPG
jgi:phospholipase/carboxylesterase